MIAPPMKCRIANTGINPSKPMPGTNLIRPNAPAGTTNPTTAISFSGSLPNCRASTTFDTRFFCRNVDGFCASPARISRRQPFAMEPVAQPEPDLDGADRGAQVG